MIFTLGHVVIGVYCQTLDVYVIRGEKMFLILDRPFCETFVNNMSHSEHDGALVFDLSADIFHLAFRK